LEKIQTLFFFVNHFFFMNENQLNDNPADSSSHASDTPPQTTIKFDESTNKELKEYQVQYHEKHSQKPLSRSSTGQSSADFDTKSVRSVLMHKMSLVKRRRKSIDEAERVEGPPYHTMDLDTVTQLLKSDLEDGLHESVIEERRTESGYNEMEGEGGVNPVKLMIKQFTNIMVLILLIAMVSTFIKKKTKTKH
jgi:magnesium-transporting ATPase (P-type)